jgi:SAM-dependent MidA family methyltransferase
LNRLEHIITAEIDRRGFIPFARFMELALYCPVYGYYEKEADTVGRRGDFYTSVSVGSLFGELLAFQFGEWLEGLDSGGKAGQQKLVEAGAHDGRLAEDILTGLLQFRRGVFDRVEYWIVEPSEARSRSQQKRLADFGDKVRWATKMADAGGAEGVEGVIFSNELLDAMPVHRIGWDKSRETWLEWGVGRTGEGFVWVQIPDGESEVLDETGHGKHRMVAALSQLNGVLPDGYTIEICPPAEQWWQEAAGKLRRGELMTLDYGTDSATELMPGRNAGTLRAYWRHRLSADVLANPGQQDITAHVDFAAIQAAGEAAGLKTEAFVTQEKFLTEIARSVWQQNSGFGEWSPARTRQFQTLTHPEHLGRAFRVLVQSRG